MKFAKKISIVIMASFLIFTVFSVNNASAQTLDIAKYDTINNDNVVQPYSAAKETTVFVVGLLAGWIIDGILIVNTGFSGGDWAAKALSYKKKHKSCTNIFFSKITGEPFCHSSGSRKF